MFVLESGVRVILSPAVNVTVSPTLPASKLVPPTVIVPKALLLSIVDHSLTWPQLLKYLYPNLV